MLIDLTLLQSYFEASNTDNILPFSDDYITAASALGWLQVKGQVKPWNAMADARGCCGGRQCCSLSFCGAIDLHADGRQDFFKTH